MQTKNENRKFLFLKIFFIKKTYILKTKIEKHHILILLLSCIIK